MVSDPIEQKRRDTRAFLVLGFGALASPLQPVQHSESLICALERFILLMVSLYDGNTIKECFIQYRDLLRVTYRLGGRKHRNLIRFDLNAYVRGVGR